MRITGILDWEAARIDHPALDFDFAEWGRQMWRRADRFGEIRESMWRAYLRARGLNLQTVHGLHLLFTLI
jgi:aminoglycoside phosphotransferase (APT) family kinase protein